MVINRRLKMNILHWNMLRQGMCRIRKINNYRYTGSIWDAGFGEQWIVFLLPCFNSCLLQYISHFLTGKKNAYINKYSLWTFHQKQRMNVKSRPFQTSVLIYPYKLEFCQEYSLTGVLALMFLIFQQSFLKLKNGHPGTDRVVSYITALRLHKHILSC